MTIPVLAVCVDVVGKPLKLVSHTLDSEAVIGGKVFKEGLAVKDSLYALDNGVDFGLSDGEVVTCVDAGETGEWCSGDSASDGNRWKV